MNVLLGKDHLVAYRIIKALITNDFSTPSVSTAYCIPLCGDVNINRNSSLNLNRVNICCGLLNYLKKFTTVIWLVVRKMSLKLRKYIYFVQYTFLYIFPTLNLSSTDYYLLKLR